LQNKLSKQGSRQPSSAKDSTIQLTACHYKRETSSEQKKGHDNIQKWILNKVTVSGPCQHMSRSQFGEGRQGKGKGEGWPVTCQAGTGDRGIVLPTLEPALKGVGVSTTLRPALTPGKRPGTHCTSSCEYTDKSRGKPIRGAPQAWCLPEMTLNGESSYQCLGLPKRLLQLLTDCNNTVC
jgi:hypothetical protein